MTHFQQQINLSKNVETIEPIILNQEDDEVVKEKMLLLRINRLPEEIQRIVEEFSPVVKEQRFLSKYEYVKKWVIENTDRIMDLVSGWPKQCIGIALNRIMKNNEPSEKMYGYVKGHPTYLTITSTRMLDIINYFIFDAANNKFKKNKNKKNLFPYYKKLYGTCKQLEEFDTMIKIHQKKKRKEQRDKSKEKNKRKLESVVI
jgi:hypothetical protein